MVSPSHLALVKKESVVLPNLKWVGKDNWLLAFNRIMIWVLFWSKTTACCRPHSRERVARLPIVCMACSGVLSADKCTTSSTNPIDMVLGNLSKLSRSELYKMYSMTNKGEPWGSPLGTLLTSDT